MRRRRAIRASRLFATDGTADWLLWRIPDLRGRIAYDVRFELYDPETLDRISRYGNREGADWKSLADGYPVVIVDDRGHLRAFRAEPGREGDISRQRDRGRPATRRTRPRAEVRARAAEGIGIAGSHRDGGAG